MTFISGNKVCISVFRTVVSTKFQDLQRMEGFQGEEKERTGNYFTR
jgi:hypothetical protein